ncbi:MAG: hypothetical protein R3E82_17840 [Pseudomonadales bacterium]
MKQGLSRTAGVVAIALLMPIIPFVLLGELPGERWLSASDDNSLRFALTGAGLLVIDVLLPVPSSIIATLLGARLGFLAGWLAGCLGLTLGNLIGYGVGRLWPARYAPDIPDRPTLLALILSRPVPIVAEAVTIAAGAARAPFAQVALASLAGNLAYTGVLAASGAALLSTQWHAVGLLVTLAAPVLGWLLWQRSRTAP